MKPSIQSAIAVISLTLMASNHALLERTGKAAQKTEVTAQGSTTVLSTKRPGYQIPEQNLQIPDDLKPCAERLRTIYGALKSYEKDKGIMPDWLSDLVPDYLSTETLIWPEDRPKSTPLAPDQHLPCSFGYQYSSSLPVPRDQMSYRAFKDQERKVWGDVVPLVRYYIGKQCLNLSFNGRIYMSGTAWEREIQPQAGAPEVLVLREISVPASSGPRPVRTKAEHEVLARDDFDGKLALRWEIINPNFSSFSLTKKPGTLTITTKNGHFSKSYTNFENLFLIDSPVALGEDLQITAGISSFQPERDWNQAGIVCWDDQDNYVKFVHEWSSFFGGQSFTISQEIAGRDRYAFHSAPSRAQTVWLRIIKHGSSYQCSTSTDGKFFVAQGSVFWKTDSPKRVGLYANNGSTQDASVPNLDASFEFFEVATLPSEAAKTGPVAQAATPASTGKYRIPPENLKIPDDCKACAEKLHNIYEALSKYEKNKGRMPDWLSDLVPDYLNAETMFCPDDPGHTTRYWPDPNLPCSYCYELNPTELRSQPPLDRTMRHYKTLQRRLFGDVVPIVRCFHHSRVLNLPWDGQIYTSPLVFERLFIPNYSHRMLFETDTAKPVTRRTSTHENDLESFIQEMDNTYPFFELKGIRGDWEQTKNRLREKIKDCKSDEQFLKIVAEGVLCLRDSHMWFSDSKVPVPQRPTMYYPGLSFMPATNERVVVMSCREGLDPDLKIGTIVSKIDGKNARQYLEEQAKARWAEGGISGPQRARLFAYRIGLRSENKSEKHLITILVDGKEREIELTSDIEAVGWPHWYNQPENLKQVGSCSYTKLPSGVGYVYLRRVDGSTGPGLKEAFSTYSDAKGWIIDLRGNGGGGYDQALYDALQALPNPLAVLIDAGCMSAGETLARDFVQRGKARLFGSKTAGASSAKRSWTFPSGIASLSVPTRSRWGPDGNPIEFIGVQPHVNVEAVPEEVQRGLNSAILRAEEYLAEVGPAPVQ